MLWCPSVLMDVMPERPHSSSVPPIRALGCPGGDFTRGQGQGGLTEMGAKILWYSLARQANCTVTEPRNRGMLDVTALHEVPD